MASTATMAEVAALIGDPARTSMLQALMDGRALTAGGHLGQLTSSGLLSVTQQGRHRYHKLAAPQVAQLLESLMLVAAGRDRARWKYHPVGSGRSGRFFGRIGYR